MSRVRHKCRTALTAASETYRSEPVGRLQKHAGLLDRSLEGLRRQRRDRHAVIDRPCNLPVGRPQRPVASTDANAELRRNVVGDHRLQLHAGAFVRGLRVDAGDLPGIAKEMIVDAAEIYVRQVGDVSALSASRLINMVSPLTPTRNACHVSVSVMIADPADGTLGMQLMLASGAQPNPLIA
jgi:hypothetical protein